MAANPFDLRGRRILITGVSQGIGRAIAMAASTAGARVAGMYLGADQSDRPGGAFLRVDLEPAGVDHLQHIADDAIVLLTVFGDGRMVFDGRHFRVDGSARAQLGTRPGGTHVGSMHALMTAVGTPVIAR